MLPQPPRKPDAKVEGRDDDSPMKKFSTLARRLLKVPKSELPEQQEKYEIEQRRRAPR